MGDITDEVRRLVDDGVIEVTLLGQNVNSYGRDLDGRPMFSKLLWALNDIDGLERVRFTSPHPKDFKQDTVEAMAGAKVVCEHIHLPLQSGSDTCLRRMKRAYTRRKYLEKAAMVADSIPGVAITTDIIVGFPGETEQEFADTMSVVKEVRYDAAYTFQYSSRPGTVAATLEGHLDKAVVQERFERLVALQDEISLQRNVATIGRDEEVVVEGPSKKDPAVVTGRTRTNKLVHFADADAEEGSLRTVTITEAHPHHLMGRFTAGRSAPARPRMSLPLLTGTGCN
jgi:tRNA-2-methylthio-N6-dimethylallyladenosine synthase